MDTKVKQAAALVAAGLRKNGWCQHVAFSGSRCCMLGANERYVRSIQGAHGVDRLDSVLEDQLGGAISKFNDAPGRTIEEVLAVYDSIANS